MFAAFSVNGAVLSKSIWIFDKSERTVSVSIKFVNTMNDSFHHFGMELAMKLLKLTGF